MTSKFQSKERAENPEFISHFSTIVNQKVLTPAIRAWDYEGSGTEDDPYVIVWIKDDPRDPTTWPTVYKWIVTLTMSMSVLAVSFGSSVYVGGSRGLGMEFHAGTEIIISGISFYVLGFALAPLVFAPLSELYGRQVVFIVTYSLFVIFSGAAVASNNIATVIVLRFFCGVFGSSPVANAGGLIADMFNPKNRGLAMSLFAAAPFMGPVLGPIAGGFLGQAAGWRWVLALAAIFSAVVLGSVLLVCPETYAPVLLRKRAEALSKETGKIYKSKVDIQRKRTAWEILSTALLRPWLLLIREPIVLLLSLYMAIVYGTLYILFATFPIVYQEKRGWSQGIGGLAFIGVALGFLLAVCYNVFFENERYARRAVKAGGFASPEARLPSAIVGGVALPIGLFWFAWTNSPHIHWAVSICSGIPFGFGMVVVFLSIMNYLVDAYTIYAASVLAANSVLRSLFGAAFPLFTNQMYHNLGIHWAATIPAALALVCVPLPFLFYTYGARIRERCRYAAEAGALMKQIQNRNKVAKDGDPEIRSESTLVMRAGSDEENGNAKEGKDIL